MSTEPQALTPPTPMQGAALDQAASTRSARAAELWPLLAILTALWVYVAFSNVFRSQLEVAALESLKMPHLYAGSPARLLQHLILYPVFIGCVLLSQRLGWRRSYSVPLQLLVAVSFAVAGARLLVPCQKLLHDPNLLNNPFLAQLPRPHDFGDWLAGPGPLLLLAGATGFLLAYGFALALVAGFSLYRRSRDVETRLAELERAWNAARLTALRSQLSPHTLFNLLHTIRGHISWDPRAAQSMVVQLGDLLRRLLSAGERDFSRLSEEIQLASLYLELQQKRFADRLTLTLPAGALPDAWVPSLILHPLAENAVVHGLAGHEGPVTIRIDVETQQDGLVLRVTNTMAQSKLVNRDGIGLRNIHERLAVQFGSRASLRATADAGTWIATIRLPLLRERP
jgi:two-component system, LytTR family, sensor kinase